MSSILRALKKLENEPRHQEEIQPPLDSRFVPLANTGPRKPPGIFFIIIGVGLVCGLVILTGWWLLSEKIPPTPIASQNISSQKEQQPAAVPVELKTSEAPENSTVSGESRSSSRDMPDVLQIRGREPESRTLKSQQPSVSPIGQQRNLSAAAARPAQAALLAPAAITPPDTASLQKPAEESGVAAAGTPEISGQVTTMPEVPVLADTDIKLQAITWSAEPGKRIAVISNRILRQGEMVDGFLVDTINQDDVILNDKGKKWKLLFRIK